MQQERFLSAGSWVLVPECHEKADPRTAASDGFDEFSSRIC